MQLSILLPSSSPFLFPPILVLKLTSNLCALETAAILMTQELDDFLKIAHNLEGLNICPEAPNCPL
jgi:hypothetical protein